ncbi:MAG: dTDP-glucose 4,6-dehydratase [Candidatus Cloacimonadota bacterium]|nr:MAG: dTDP-glucose 4,6-dehydratase [Candidatus Cloacimonadota bacterium]PIE79296.1 MAG: dTDP-glucose 4,6-dehydratase [Candidatus Delongbacteria bacterium]
MKILVTGGAGFIGSNFIHMVLDKRDDYSIVNVDLLTYAGNLDNLKSIEKNRNYKFVKADISDREAMDTLFKNENFDWVINFAAESHVDRSIENPEIFIQSNIIGTQVLLDMSKIYGVKRYLQVSTDEVYGSLGKTGYFTENSSIKPSSPYSASKTSADMYVNAYYKTFGVPTLITRCSNNYGPFQFPEKLIPLVISNARADKDIPVYGDGKNIRDWLFVEDHCEAILTVIEKGEVGSVYNVGGNNEIQNIDIVKLILKHLGKPESLITYVKDRLGHDKRYAIDATKIKDELGWEPKYRFEEAIKSTIDWYISNDEWLENILSGEYKEYYKKMYGNI